MNKNMYLLNTVGVLQEVYTLDSDFEKVYLKIKGVEDPIVVPITELSSWVEDLPQIIYSISFAAKNAFIERSIDTADLIDELLKEKESEDEHTS